MIVSATADQPCVRRCCLDDTEVCLGCYRSLAEILSWRTWTAAERAIALDEAIDRRVRDRS